MTPESASQTLPLPSFTLIAGGYERLLYGLQCSPSPNQSTLKTTLQFVYPSHISCIKALATTGRYLVSGSTDELIKIYDLKTRSEVGTLMSHDGTITSLKFWTDQNTEKGGHLVSSAEDGKICVYRLKDWELLKTLIGHKTAVKDIDVHPSGKILLSIAKGKILFCWDLMTGKKAYSLKLQSEAEKVKWTRSGFLVLNQQSLDFWNMATSKITLSIHQSQRINAFVVLTLAGQECVITGGEDKKLYVYLIPTAADLDSGTVEVISPAFILDDAHNQRIKDMTLFETTLITCSSDGAVKIWSLADLQVSPVNEKILEGALVCAGEYDCGTRLVCLSAGPVAIGSDDVKFKSDKKLQKPTQAEVKPGLAKMKPAEGKDHVAPKSKRRKIVKGK